MLRRYRPVLTVIAVLALAFVPAQARNKPAERYMKLYSRANAKIDKGSWNQVVRVADRMEGVAPRASRHLGFAAKAHAQLGDHDTAFASLERWIEAGWTLPDGLKGVDLLEPLHGDARYEALSARAAELGAAFEAAQRQYHDELPLVGAEPFDSAEALVAAFEGRRMTVGEASIITPIALYYERMNGLHDAEIASARRYVADHADADDAVDAALAAVHASLRYKKYWDNFDGDARIVIATASEFIDRWPDSEHRPEVELARAVATWKAYGEDDAEGTLPRRSRQTLPLLSAIGETFPDTPEATKARIWHMNVAMALSDGEITDEIAELYGKVEPTFEENDELKQYAWSEAPLAMFQINGRELFDATDLDGNRWNWETMEGKVVLIDFWATWCGPCIADLPHIKETYEKYKDAGFAIVGVSLDDDDEETFLKECENLGIEWPQVYDGQGWDNALAQTFSVSGIPTPVLIDRDGKVVGVHGQVRGDHLIEEVGKLID
jgi:thiol-disulfide isomerase/thioredoxin/outer membrane protein assembly factor BamD (BamD/ComL family)